MQTRSMHRSSDLLNEVQYLAISSSHNSVAENQFNTLRGLAFMNARFFFDAAGGARERVHPFG